MTANPFTPATRSAVPVKVALVGPSGSGKTYTALTLARGIAGEDGRVALIDTEHGSASLYADEFTFDTNLMQPPYEPAKFAGGITVAAQAGYDVLVIDGISPAWNGPGGVMEIVDNNALGGNSWSGWAKGSPAHQLLVQAILAAPIHLICTMRSKTAWVLETNERGKQTPRKVGMEPVQRDGIDYEFSVVGELDLDHAMRVTKSRLRGLDVGAVIQQPGQDLGRRLLEASQGASHPEPTSEPSVTSEPGESAASSSADDEEHKRAHEQLSTADLKLTARDRQRISEPQRKRLIAIASKAGVSEAAQHNIVEAITGQPSRSEIPRYLYDKVVAEIQLVGQGSVA